jgi:flavin reductase (DIM6/NTAB) family NADH-FMN oxidoreductase RutF
MFYDAVANSHGLQWDPFKALVSPRPIGWISTLDQNGVVNLAPYSFFNAVSTDPHFVMFSSGGRKDSQRNAEETGEFVCSLATFELREAMNRTSQHVGPEVEYILAHDRIARSRRRARDSCHRARPGGGRAYRRRGNRGRQGRRDQA